ncbi:MAG TPA: class I SAM-dependent methyltransferase [Planctomycetota bacterium]|jgi:SAM-dependent methyltransferase|nr:class I SAM-dependent methyltransferase [Planctomycetota bacterium]
MLRCPRCGLRYVSPRPTAEGVAQLYTRYLPDGEGEADEWDRAMEAVFEDAARRVEGAVGGPGRVLDVGCGFGRFLETMERRGWEPFGIDPSPRAGERARARLRRATLWPGLFPEDLRGAPPLHAITAFYVLEHVRDPLAFLRAAFAALVPRGVLLLRVPHTAPLKRALGWLRVPNRLYDMPAHLFDYAPAVLRRLLAEAGFGPVEAFVGGATRFGGLPRRAFSAVAEGGGEAVFRASGGRWILPGLSYSALGRKRGP